MTRRNLLASVISVTTLAAVVSMAVAAQDRFTLKAPNGVAFSEFRGYDTWQVVAPSQTDDGIKAITGNAVSINAFKEGIPGNGKPVPDGAMFAKIEWSKKKNALSP